VDWVESYERNFTLMVAEVLSAIPPADATALLELQPDDPTIQAPLAELTDFIAQNGLGLDMAGRSERVERVFRGVASMLGADSSDTISSQLGLYDLKLFGGTPEGWDALCGLTRMDSCVPHLIQVQLGLTQQHYLPFNACGTQPLLSSFKARASHFIHSVGIRVLKNRLYSALPDPKGVSKLVTMIASILPIDSKTLLIEPKHWAIVIAAFCESNHSEEELKARASVMFGAMDADGDGWVAKSDLVRFYSELRYYGLKLIGGAMYDISFFDRSLDAPGKEAYQKLARRIEKWSRATTLAEYSPVVEPDAVSLWNRIAGDAEYIDGASWQAWTGVNSDKLQHFSSLGSHQVLSVIQQDESKPAQNKDPEPTPVSQTLEEHVQSAVEVVVRVTRHFTDSVGNVDNKADLFTAPEVDIDAIYEDPKLALVADVSHLSIQMMQAAGRNVPYRFGLLCTILAFGQFEKLEVLASLLFSAIDRSSQYRITKQSIESFVQNFREFGTCLVLCLLRHQQSEEGAKDCEGAISWVEENGIYPSGVSSEEMVNSIFQGLVQLVAVGKSVSIQDATDEVCEDGVSIRTWNAWAAENPKHLAALPCLF